MVRHEVVSPEPIEVCGCTIYIGISLCRARVDVRPHWGQASWLTECPDISTS